MTIKFIPSNRKVEMDTRARDTQIMCALELVIEKLDNLEQHLEIITEEELDECPQ